MHWSQRTQLTSFKSMAALFGDWPDVPSGSEQRRVGWGDHRPAAARAEWCYGAPPLGRLMRTTTTTRSTVGAWVWMRTTTTTQSTVGAWVRMRTTTTTQSTVGARVWMRTTTTTQSNSSHSYHTVITQLSHSYQSGSVTPQRTPPRNERMQAP